MWTHFFRGDFLRPELQLENMWSKSETRVKTPKIQVWSNYIIGSFTVQSKITFFRASNIGISVSKT